VIFLDGLPGEDAAFAVLNSPAHPELEAALAAGFLVRVFADGAGDDPADIPASREAALASGAHHLSSDFPADTDLVSGFRFDDGATVRCNPSTAPAACSAAALEEPGYVRN
jgi:hypothetical protein